MAKGKSREGKNVSGQKTDAKEEKGLISIDGLTIQERLQAETKAWVSGRPRPVAKEVVRMWLSAPDYMHGMAPDLLRTIGVADEDVIWIMGASTQTDLAERIGVTRPMLNAWIQTLREDADGMKEVRKFFQKVTKNVLGALYRKVIVEGDANRVKLFLQVVENWKEPGMPIPGGGGIGYQLEPEEKAALDKIIKDNALGADV